MPIDKCHWCGKPSTAIVYRISDGLLTPACRICKATAIGSGLYQYRRKLTATEPTNPNGRTQDVQTMRRRLPRSIP